MIVRCPKPEKRSAKPRKRIARGKRPRRQRKSAPAALAREADRLWSLLVRARGKCEAEGPHAGPLQGAHGFSRRYRHTRWALLNGFCLCAACHMRYTHDPLRWEGYLRDAWGDAVYDELRKIALRTAPFLVAEVLARLKREAKERGIE